MWLRKGLPVAGFVATLAVIIFLLGFRVVPGALIGLASRLDVPVSAGVAGRITSILVTTHQQVEAGSVIATLDDTAARLDREVALLRIEELGAELQAARQRLQLEDVERTTDLLNLRRRLELDRLDAMLGQVEEKGRKSRDDAALVGLAADLTRVSSLAGDALAIRRLDSARADHDALSARSEGRSATIGAWEQAELSALERLEELPVQTDELGDELLLPLRAAIRTAEKRLEFTRLAIDQCAIRAPVTGQVAAILQRPGEEVVVDEPILNISAASTSRVVAWLKEEQFTRIQVGDAIQIRQISAPSVLRRGEVESLGPAVAVVPIHALRDPTIPEFGLPVIVRLPDSLHLTPGERVQVQLLP